MRETPAASAFAACKKLLLGLVCQPWFCLVLITALVAINFGRSLGSYFLADDIGELRYVQQIFSGDWGLFWSNFCGNYMQVPNMSVYRPVLLLTLVLDYALWQGNAFGYYFSNLFYFTASAFLLYLFVSKLAAPWGKQLAGFCGLVSALLFVANPLHCESISWVVGRVDSACAMFYLAGLCLFLHSLGKQRSSLWIAGGLFSFALAICTKEMAIGFAPTLSLIAFFFPELFSGEAKSAPPGSSFFGLSSLRDGLKRAWLFSRPAWFCTGLYFLVRFAALGTLLGGYNGSVGAGQTANALSRWLDLDSWHRFFMPFPQAIFSQPNDLEFKLLAVYAGLISLLAFRLLAGRFPWRILFFQLFWLLTAAAPIYRLFGLGENLEGARFCYFMTVVTSCTLPLLLLAPYEGIAKPLETRFRAALLVLALLAAGFLSKSAYATNLLWLHAGKEVKAFQSKALQLAKSASPGEKLLLLNVPKRHACAHMILNGPTLQMLLSRPFVDGEYSQPFLTFDSILFGDENTIDGDRLGSLVGKENMRGPFLWRRDKKEFVELKLSRDPAAKTLSFSGAELLPASSLLPYSFGRARYCLSRSGGLEVSGVKEGDGVLLQNISLSPLDYAYLKLRFRSAEKKVSLPFQVHWRSEPALAESDLEKESSISKTLLAGEGYESDGQTRQVYVPLGRAWRWYAAGTIRELSLALPCLPDLEIKELSLLSRDDVCPRIDSNAEANQTGVLPLQSGLVLNIFSKQGEKILIQASKKEYFFENLGSVAPESLGGTWIKDGRKCSFDLEKEAPAAFAEPGYYQIRACSLTKDAGVVGDFSQALTIRKSGKP